MGNDNDDSNQDDSSSSSLSESTDGHSSAGNNNNKWSLVPTTNKDEGVGTAVAEAAAKKNTDSGDNTSGDRVDGGEDRPDEKVSSTGPLHAPKGPRDMDVLVGRGSPYQNFPGNKRMLKIISKYKEEYFSRPRDRKKMFVETVLEEVLKDGTRFLRLVKEKDQPDRWEEVNRAVAGEKVWHALRSKEGQRRKARQEAREREGAAAQATPSSTSGEGAAAQATPSSTSGEGTPISSGDGPIVEVLLRDIISHLSNAVAGANLLASLIFGAPKQQAAMNPAATRQDVNSAASILSQEIFRQASAPSTAQAPPPSQKFSSNNYPGIMASSFGTGGAGALTMDLSRHLPGLPISWQQQHQSTAAASQLQNQGLQQALDVLMQVAQQGAPR